MTADYTFLYSRYTQHPSSRAGSDPKKMQKKKIRHPWLFSPPGNFKLWLAKFHESSPAKQ